MEALRRLREHFTSEQAEDIVAVLEERAVSRDYLDSRFDALASRLQASIERSAHDLTWRMLGIAGVAITIVGIIDKLIHG
jgi:hypothetical protein